LYNSETFERVKPTIALQSPAYWNLSKPLSIRISDASGISHYKVILNANGEEQLLSSGIFEEKDRKKELDLEISYPKIGGVLKTSEVTLRIEAIDGSRWDFFAGNKAIESHKLSVDQRQPNVSIVAHNYHIQTGGSGIVIFHAKDENLDELYIETSFGKKFIPQPFYKPDYYISLLAWPVDEKSFSAKVVAIDKAGNVKQSSINIYAKKRTYKISNIALKERFLKETIADLAAGFELTQGVDDSLEQFKIINEEVRAQNEKLIHEITSQVPTTTVHHFNPEAFYPLKNAKSVASYGEKRFYSYEGKRVSTAYHLGIDLASVQNGEISIQNAGNTLFASYNGIYGNMPILHHGMGLYTLYGHCSEIRTAVDTQHKAGDVIATTGMSGYAFGDHLHFGVLVQGIEVRPAEWMDKKWIKDNITGIIAQAKQIIDNL